MMMRRLSVFLYPFIILLFFFGIAGCGSEAEEPGTIDTGAETPGIEAEKARGKANTAMGIYYDVLHGKAEVRQLEDALRELEEARALRPRNERIEKDYIQVLLALGETETAVAASEQLLQQDERHLINHAMMLDRYQGFEAARPYYEAYTEQLRARIDTENISAEQLGDGITLAIGLLLMNKETQAYALIESLQEQHPGARIWGNYLHLQRREFSKENYLRDIYPEIG